MWLERITAVATVPRPHNSKHTMATVDSPQLYCVTYTTPLGCRCQWQCYAQTKCQALVSATELLPRDCTITQVSLQPQWT
jgi:hypothetical protein